MQKPELLAPAGSLEKGKMALLYGADALYLGGTNFGLRAFASNFDKETMREMIEYAHSLNKKIYVTVNIVPHNEDLINLPEYLLELQELKVDALIISDLGVWNIAKNTVPQMSLHVSTQANTSNWSAVEMWQKLGADRVVLARELGLTEIAEIKDKTKMELEVFVHGAMCISHSGRCLLSNYMAGRDANKGACVQACRWKYSLVEENRPNEHFPVLEDERGTYIFNSKDLCLINYVPELIKAGVDSFKIEGRMKSMHYVASVVSVYRQAIDSYFAAPENYIVQEKWLEELAKVSHRSYTQGFMTGKTDENSQVYTTSSYQQTHDFVGLTVKYDALAKRLYIEQRNNIKSGEELEILQPNGKLLSLVLVDMQDDKGQEISVAPHPRQIISVPYLQFVAENSLVRRKINV
ncbi:U32 family peptidase C-terminal domain-containing protein [Succinispira mobilis]|uniref:U32 family peptidase C-terminal domain-containing protein n=1 Tax=Succinispira mobilis TaxID=78120 RepID=UPI00048FE58E